MINFINFNKMKRLDVGLLKIKGIGKFFGKKINYKMGYNRQMYRGAWATERVDEEILTVELQNNYILGKELEERVNKFIVEKGVLGSYEGIRHQTGLPVRGQRTKNNIVTAKKLNRLLLPKMELWSRMPSKDRRREKRKEKREKKQERKK